MIPELPVRSLIVQGLNSPVQSERLKSPPGLRGVLFVCWGQSIASFLLMGLQRCPELIIPEVILKVAQPQMLFAGGKVRREAYLRILALFYIQEV